MNIGLGIGIPFTRSSLWASIFTPSALFLDGSTQGVWYDPGDITTLYRDTAGTQPVTAVEQPVGLMLDKSKGLVLGPELVTNGDFSQGATGWTLGSGWSVSGGKLIATSVAFAVEAKQDISTLVAGSRYVVSFDVVVTSGTLKVNLSNFGVSPTELLISASGTYTYRPLQSGTAQITFWASSTFTGSIDNISVRELPGNHAFNSSGNSANFPVLSARYNLLTNTENFSDAVWGATAGNVTVSSGKIIPNATSGNHYVSQGISTLGVTHTITARVKQAGYTWIKLVAFNQYANFDLANGVVGTNYSGVSRTISAVGDGSYICTFTFTSTSAASNQGCIIKVGTADNASWDSANYSGNGVDGIQVYYADLRVANDALNQPAYQRVNTSTDYDTVGFKPYLRFNGVSQWLQTNSIDFTYGDKMFVCAGVRKLSNAAEAILYELSSNLDTNNGAFNLFAPGGISVARDSAYVAVSKGTAKAFCGPAAASYPTPVTNIVTSADSISGPSIVARVNGTQVATSTATQGTGNYGNYPLYIGARAGTSLFFNGNLYQLVIAAGSEIRVAEEDSDLFLSESGDFITAETTVAVIQSAIEQTEAFVNRKTSAF